MNLRRESCVASCSAWQIFLMARLPADLGRLVACAGRQMHGVADALVGAAAADIGHRLVDVLCRSACGFFFSSAAAAMIWPDWQ